jgi:alpha-N-arabinofuranosidase
MAKKNVVTVRLDEVIGTINPNIYGHFIEHLGRCIYPGIWVGEQSKIPNVQGLRTDVVAALKSITPPVVRWPGGCFADAYHWQDGIGPRKHRPRRPNLWWGGEESNAFGTDEFLTFCRYLDTEPYICVNVGAGSPEEACSWLEYCTYVGESRYAQLRAANGHPAPYTVRYWGVGNENWGCGGQFDPVSYAREYRRFATYLKGRVRDDPARQLVACGHTRGDWNLRFLEAVQDHLVLLDHLSIHYYFSGRRNPFGGDVAFTEDEYFNLLLDVQNLEHQIQQTIHVVDFVTAKRKDIGIIVDEWGTWHPQATVEAGLYQQNTLRDAILAAVVLNLFNTYSRRVVMANLAQTVNVLQSLCLTKGEKTILTPTYYVYDMYKTHMGGDALKVEVQSPTIREPPPTPTPPQEPTRTLKSLHAADASASLSNGGKRLTITLVNQSLDAVETEIWLVGGREVARGDLRVLTAGDVRDYNDFDAPNTVVPMKEPLTMKGNRITYMAPKHAISTFILRIQ